MWGVNRRGCADGNLPCLRIVGGSLSFMRFVTQPYREEHPRKRGAGDRSHFATVDRHCGAFSGLITQIKDVAYRERRPECIDRGQNGGDLGLGRGANAVVNVAGDQTCLFLGRTGTLTTMKTHVKRRFPRPKIFFTTFASDFLCIEWMAPGSPQVRR